MKTERTLLLGTANAGKIDELRVLLQGIQVKSLSDFPGPAPEVEEDGETYKENALKKAVAYHRWSHLPVVADDSGLEVDALDGAPGIYSARFGGAKLSWPERWNYLLEQLKGHPPEKWTARFRCVICFYDGKEALYFEGVAPGRILPKPTGRGGFGYDPIVYCDDLGMSFAEATSEAKNRVSHRAKALFALRRSLDHRDWQS